MDDDRGKETTRRALLSASPGAGGGGAASLFQHLAPLQAAADQLADTWRPDDPQYRADFYRQIMMNLSWAYFAFFHADAEHPDWAPLWNCVYADQPNPDDIYLYAPIRGDLTYRITGFRGTCALLTFTINRNMRGLSDEEPSHLLDYDHRDLTVGPNGEVDVILSAERPAGHSGDWLRIEPEADALTVRYRRIDWIKEDDPQLSIACLDPVPLKRRLTPEEIYSRIDRMAKLPALYSRRFLHLQNSVKDEVGINRFLHVKYSSGLTKQIYWPAVFELGHDEALIIETDMPKVRPYWNIQLNDPYFNAAEYVYRASSLNEGNSTLSSDGKLRAVIALEDPGVPNWLDPAGFTEGTIYGRWFDCDTNPMPIIRRVPLADLRKHLPADTAVVAPEERAEQLAARVRASQRRRRW